MLAPQVLAHEPLASLIQVKSQPEPLLRDVVHAIIVAHPRSPRAQGVPRPRA